MSLRSLTLPLLTGLAAAALAAPALAGQINVPGDLPDLRTAILAASPGDTIILHGGTHPPCTVDKALTIMGGTSRPVLRPSQPGEETTVFVQDPAITLAGPGSGIVTFVDVEIAGTADGSYYGTAAPAITGSGFDELRILHSELRAPDWIQVTGYAAAVDAIDVMLPAVLVVDSTVIGGQGDDDGSGAVFGQVPPGALGIDARASVVTVLDSEVRGGDGLDTFVGDPFTPCPFTCEEVVGGEGGPAIAAACSFHAGSVVAGGEGASLHCFGPFAPVYLCDKADGPAFMGAVDVVALPGTLLGSGPLQQGDVWTLTWFAPSPQVLLVFSVPAQPVFLGAKGWLFAEPSSLLLFAEPGGLQLVSLPVPLGNELLGLPLAFQIYDPATGLTRPVLGAVTTM